MAPYNSHVNVLKTRCVVKHENVIKLRFIAESNETIECSIYNRLFQFS